MFYRTHYHYMLWLAHYGLRYQEFGSRMSGVRASSLRPNKSFNHSVGTFIFCNELVSIPDILNTNRRLPALGYEHDRILWMIQGVFIGVAVKIVRSEQRANNFGHRKRRRSRGCREFKSLHSDQNTE